MTSAAAIASASLQARSSVNDQFLSRYIQHATFLQRLQAGEARRLVELLDKNVLLGLVSEFESELARLGDAGLTTSAKLQLLERKIVRTNELTRAGMTKLSGEYAERIHDVAITEAEFTKRLFADTLPKHFQTAFEVPSQEILRQVALERPIVGQPLSKWFDSLAGSTQARVNTALRAGIANGEAPRELARRLLGENRDGSGGAIATTRRQAETIARTATNHAAHAAREQTFSQNSDLIKGIQYVATLDSRTTITCITLDGKVFPIDEGPRPPQHPGCRSTTTPVLKGFSELGIPGLGDVPPGTRASMNGQVPEKLTYGDWLKGQPADVQDKVLGKGKADLFRTGKLHITKYADAQGSPLTLEQLREANGLKSAARVKRLPTELTPKDINRKPPPPPPPPAALPAPKPKPTPPAPTSAPSVPPPSVPKPKPAHKAPSTPEERLKAKFKEHGLEDVRISVPGIPNKILDDLLEALEFGLSSSRSSFEGGFEIKLGEFKTSKTLAAFGRRTKGPNLLQLNPRVFKNPAELEELLKRQRILNWFVGEDVRYLLNHEMVHAIDLGKKSNAAGGLFFNRTKRYLKDNRPSKYELSRYGLKNDDEMLAEAVAKAMLPEVERDEWLDGLTAALKLDFKESGLDLPEVLK